MEGIFNSKDLYEFLEDQKQQNISKTREVSLYYKATSKSMEDDEYSLRIWLGYIQLLMDGTGDAVEVRETFKMIKMRFCKFYAYWEAYIRFEIGARNGDEHLNKILQQSIDFVNVKEFSEKRSVLEHLQSISQCVESGDDLSVFARPRRTVYRRLPGGSSPVVKKECRVDPADTPLSGMESDESARDRLSLLCEKENCGENRQVFQRQEAEGARLKFSPGPKEPWSLRGIPVQLEKEHYAQGVTAEINAVLGRTDALREIQPRERIAIKGRDVEVLKQIGKGGSSRVYKVLAGSSVYALKKVELVGDEKILMSYTNEIDLLYKFKGASEIVEIVDHEIGPGYLHILLEYGETDLAKIIRGGGLSINFIKDVWEQMLLIVRRVHRERIIHCDLKPANFLFVRGRVKLIDFGISKVIRNDTTSIFSEEQCGTVNYMSPEALAQNRSKLTRSSDIWSLGCILYEMVHTRPPLHEYPNLIQKIQRLQEHTEFKYSSTHRLAVMVMKDCLARDPKQRPTIDKLLAHRFLRGIEPECLEALVECVLHNPQARNELLDNFYRT